MSGRGRARPPSRSAQESGAGPSRRSTRHQQQQQQQQQDAGPHQEQGQYDPALSAQQHEQPEPARELDALVAAVGFHHDIDPAITGPQDNAGMPPPPLPSAKGARGHDGPIVARRGTRRETQASSVASVNSLAGTDAFSSQGEPQSSAPQREVAERVFGTPAPAASVTSSADAARARLIKAMLPRLSTASGDFLDHLCIKQKDVELWEMDRIGFKAAFDAYRARYLTGVSSVIGNPVIDSASVAKSMPVNPVDFKVIVAANLTSMLDDITPADQQDLLPLLEKWEARFLDAIAGDDPTRWDREMQEEIAQQIQMIRTHLSIYTLMKLQSDGDAEFNPVEEVARIWFDGEPSAEAIESCLGNPEDALQLRPVVPPSFGVDDALAKKAPASRFASMCHLLPKQSTKGSDLDLTEIQRTYPISEFEDGLQQFARRVFAQSKAAGQRDASQPFSFSDATSRADSQIRSQLEGDAMAHQFSQAGSSGDSNPYVYTGMERLRDLANRVPEMYSDHQLPPDSHRPAPYPPDTDSFSSVAYADPPPPGGFPSGGAIYAESAAQATSGRKRRAPGGSSANGDGVAGLAALPAKKPRARRKRNEHPAAAAPFPTPAPPAEDGTLPPISPIQSQYPPLSGPSDELDLDALSQRTREISAAARKVKEPQVRSPWVKGDVLALMHAVNIYQCKWSTIEKEIKAGTIKFERPRNQQALRDKARLLKQDLLKSDGRLPPGFDLVVLGKKEREAVIACGKNPDRREIDNGNGRIPVNTELGPGRFAVPAADPQAEAPQEAEPQPEPQPVAAEAVVG